MHKALDRPIQFFGSIGLFFVFAIFGGIWAVWLKMIYGVSFVSTSLPLLTVFLSLTGVFCILLGLLAEFQTRIYFESQFKR